MPAISKGARPCRRAQRARLQYKQRDAPYPHDIHEAAAAARASVRLFLRCGQPGAHHPTATPLPDSDAAADFDARRHPYRLQAPLAGGSVALALAHRTLATAHRVRGRAVARPLSPLEAHPPVPRRWGHDDYRRHCALPATFCAVWRDLPPGSAATPPRDFPVQAIGGSKLSPRRARSM